MSALSKSRVSSCVTVSSIVPSCPEPFRETPPTTAVTVSNARTESDILTLRPNTSTGKIPSRDPARSTSPSRLTFPNVSPLPTRFIVPVITVPAGN